MSGLRDRLIDLGYAGGWRLVRVAPEPAVARLFDAVAAWAARRPGAATRQLRRNLARVRPQAGAAELDALVSDALRSYARYWRETFRLPSMDHEAVYRACDRTIVGVQHLEAALAAGRGALVALPHTGNWDVAGVWLVGHLTATGREPTFTTVAERLRPESLYRRFVAYRESLGFEILPLTGGQPPADAIAERLAANRVVCLLADRDITASGVGVTFFGESARMPAGPARLAASTGAALLPVGCWFTPDGWGLRIHPPLPPGEPEATTQALADRFAAEIAEHPADWHMLQPLWLTDLPTGGAQ